jgi:hypothetical protein
MILKPMTRAKADYFVLQPAGDFQKLLGMLVTEGGQAAAALEGEGDGPGASLRAKASASHWLRWVDGPR